MSKEASTQGLDPVRGAVIAGLNTIGNVCFSAMRFGEEVACAALGFVQPKKRELFEQVKNALEAGAVVKSYEPFKFGGRFFAEHLTFADPDSTEFYRIGFEHSDDTRLLALVKGVICGNGEFLPKGIVALDGSWLELLSDRAEARVQNREFDRSGRPINFHGLPAWAIRQS